VGVVHSRSTDRALLRHSVSPCVLWVLPPCGEKTGSAPSRRRRGAQGRQVKTIEKSHNHLHNITMKPFYNEKFFCL
ncbi:hypothetical protein, partial [Geobacillus stearothermophilus]|uniref:hypothetical protein n=1 Tax=Geobacillus stearothermophilus TaxID=1422 RepID=UPI003D2303BF